MPPMLLVPTAIILNLARDQFCAIAHLAKSAKIAYRKALLSPRGAYLILDTTEGGLIREGAYLKVG